MSLFIAVVVASLSSCSLIDDHFDGCDETRTIECRLHIYNNIDSILDSQITRAAENDLLSALSRYYKALLAPTKYDIDFNFYDVTSNALQMSVSETINGDGDYVSVSLPSGDFRCVAQSLLPRYSGRLYMPEGQSSYTLHMYPTDAQVAVATKVDTRISNVSITVEGCADSFNVSDSTYTYYNNVDTLNYSQEASTGTFTTYLGSVLPSAPSQSWKVTVYATTQDGSITRTVLTVDKPLLPGDIRILQVTISADGAAHTSTMGVGASVTLDWKKGGEYNPTL